MDKRGDARYAGLIVSMAGPKWPATTNHERSVLRHGTARNHTCI